MTLIIRQAEARDVAALGTLGAMLMQAHYAFDRQRFLEPHEDAASGYGRFLTSMLRSDDACILVAEVDGAIEGYIYAALEPLSWKELRGPAGFIHDIAVAERVRRGGVARRLMTEAVAWLKERGAPRVILWTAAPNVAAQSLFKQLGFRTTMLEMTLET